MSQAIVQRALIEAHNYVLATLKGQHADTLPEPLRELLQMLSRAEATFLGATMTHDRGAIAQCSYCRRYTTNPHALAKIHAAYCDCGRNNGWTGSFVEPSEGAEWALHLRPGDPGLFEEQRRSGR